MKNFIKSYSYTLTGYWLRLFNWELVKIYKLPFCFEGLATALYIAPLNIVLAAPDKDGRVYFGTICHELYHAYQKSSMGLFRYLLKKCFNRSSLEQQAKIAQLDAVEWACSQDRKEFEQWEI